MSFWSGGSSLCIFPFYYQMYFYAFIHHSKWKIHDVIRNRKTLKFIYFFIILVRFISSIESFLMPNSPFLSLSTRSICTILTSSLTLGPHCLFWYSIPQGTVSLRHPEFLIYITLLIYCSSLCKHFTFSPYFSISSIHSQSFPNSDSSFALFAFLLLYSTLSLEFTA